MICQACLKRPGTHWEVFHNDEDNEYDQYWVCDECRNPNE